MSSPIARCRSPGTTGPVVQPDPAELVPAALPLAERDGRDSGRGGHAHNDERHGMPYDLYGDAQVWPLPLHRATVQTRWRRTIRAMHTGLKSIDRGQRGGKA